MTQPKVGEVHGKQILFTVPTATYSGGYSSEIGDNKKLLDAYTKQANSAYELGREKEKSGKLDEAIALYYKAAQQRERIWGSGDPALFVIYKLIGDAYFKQKKLSEAETAFRRLQLMAVKVYGVGAIEVCPVLEKIGDCCSLQHKSSDAINFYAQVCALRKRKLGETSSDTVRAVVKLSRAYAQSGDMVKARTCLEDQLKVSDQLTAVTLEKALSDLSQQTASSQLGSTTTSKEMTESADPPPNDSSAQKSPDLQTPQVTNPEDLLPGPTK